MPDPRRSHCCLSSVPATVQPQVCGATLAKTRENGVPIKAARRARVTVSVLVRPWFSFFLEVFYTCFLPRGPGHVLPKKQGRRCSFRPVALHFFGLKLRPEVLPLLVERLGSHDGFLKQQFRKCQPLFFVFLRLSRVVHVVCVCPLSGPKMLLPSLHLIPKWRKT